MINSVNALEFLKPKLITMDKFNTTTTTKILPPSSLSQTRTFVTISGHHHNTAIDSQPQQPFLFNDEIKQQERVRVQHLENHTKLQNNKCWNNFRTLYNLSASSGVKDREMCKIRQAKDDNEVDVVNVEHLSSTTITPINIQNKSAFTLDLNNKKYHNINNNNSICGNNNNIQIDSSRIDGTNNNYQLYCKQYNTNYGLINKQSPTTTMIVMSTGTQPQASTATTQRTEDQNKAYRHIESVHNYAKSKSYEDDDGNNQSPNGSRHSSYIDDEEDDDDDEEDNDDDVDAEYDNDDDIDYEDRLESNVDLDGDYEVIFNRSRHRFQKLSTSSDGALSTRNDRITSSEHNKSAQLVNILKDHKIQTVRENNKNKDSNEDEEVHIDVDVETVESQSQSPNIPIVDSNSSTTIASMVNEPAAAVACIKPDHHARRPMNAFLIFCKRHRAIVKERYKNLENRAITKILGDWWASLETNDKKCFTSLAQQNKDAFFSANPNFKWYKLPAPPLRTLTTRPANAFGPEYQEDNEASTLEIISNNTRSSNNHSNYFKLADEAQMGDLSQLMLDKSKATKQCADLQQALGETSQFMSAHITGSAEGLDENHLKRRFHNENSFSSNSSEEDMLEPKKKSARSCKGKRYQELINSGQIATAVKKSKSSIRLVVGGGDNSDVNIKQSFSNVNNLISNLSNVCPKRTVSESENMLSYDLGGFDLEERIKELPALNLDDYLQRKRNTKKKKKFSSTGKKRGGQRGNTTTSSNNNGNSNEKSTQRIQVAAAAPFQHMAKQHQQAAATAVGSQKRKARKESITRRDVAAIEQEAASLLPLTINGCCYFQDAPTALKYRKAIEKDTEATATATSQSLNNVTSTTSPIIPLQQLNSASSVSVDIFNNISCNNNNTLNDNISSTSDLLILAEVAANRTELKH
ncbi:MATH and LRR domain-containing protein PFE0570w [Calliphora vicina]|uniref:MATH and LRR domain-containing protein PFE0570w n=1 Tax=Calliphora vicina TaxID=7373 RepID=UPI00325B7F59